MSLPWAWYATIGGCGSGRADSEEWLDRWTLADPSAGVLTSSQLGSYDVAKHFVRSHYSEYFPEGIRTHLVCSGFAGFACSVTSAPIDTIKVRVMNDSTGQFRSSLDCAYKLLRHEGPLALYKGFFGCWIRLWPHTVISLMLLEQLRKTVGLKPI